MQHFPGFRQRWDIDTSGITNAFQYEHQPDLSELDTAIANMNL
jgi:hypothetical protein